MAALYPIWLFFAAFFLYFAYLHWRQSQEDMRQFAIRSREPDAEGAPAEAGISQANLDFAQDFNRYLDSTNKVNRSRHRAAAIGYLISGVMALVSMAVLLFAA